MPSALPQPLPAPATPGQLEALAADLRAAGLAPLRSSGELDQLAADGRLSISLRAGIPTDWRIKRVEHRLGAQGYTTQVECERFAASPAPITQSE